MTILVTGATGFIGKHVIRCLANSDYKIIATSNLEEEEFAEFKDFRNIRYLKCDLTDLTVDFYSFFQQPDMLIHLAWGNLPNYYSEYHLKINLIANLNFLLSLIESGLKKFSVTGTCLEYGMQNGCLNEDNATHPNNSYATAKDILRRYIEGYSYCRKFEYNWIRLFYTFGTGQNKNSLIGQLETAIMNNDEVFNMSGGEQLRDYLPVEIVADYIVRIALHNKEQKIINCCSGEPVSIRKFIEEYLISRNSNIKLNPGYYPYNDYEPMDFWGDNTKLNLLLNE